MIINAQTKISDILKYKPGSLDVIVSISPLFVKLKNPFLRKAIAPRTSIAMAAKLGSCLVEDFFKKLEPLGFVIDKTAGNDKSGKDNSPVPVFLKEIPPGKMIDCDVRPVFDAGKDPLQIILQKVNSLQPGQVLKIINGFEPTPLIHLLEKKGFEAYVEVINTGLVNTYFYKKADNNHLTLPDKQPVYQAGWGELLTRFDGRLVAVDVRELEMPLPMHAILEALDNLPANYALFVYHKRIPVFLLDELKERKFSYSIQEISNSEVNLLIFKE